MNLNYKKNGVVHVPIKVWEMSDGNSLIMYQGSRGTNPDLDFIVKYRNENIRLRSPSHTHWIVDLLLKSEHSKNDILEYIQEWIDIYDRADPFTTIEERNSYELYYNEYFADKYYNLNNLGAFSIEFLSGIIELFIKCEKQNSGAFMFRGLLTLVKEYCEGKKDFYQIVSYSKRV